MYRIIKSPDDLPDFSKAQKLVCDTETSGFYVHVGDRICGVALGELDSNDAYYIPATPETLAWFQALANDPTKTWIFHNSKFDVNMFRKENILFKGRVLDTILVAHNYVSNLHSYSLDNLTKQFLPKFAHTHYAALASWVLKHMGVDLHAKKPKPCNFSLIPLDILAPYACEDIDATRQLYQQLISLLKQDNFTPIPNQNNKSWSRFELLDSECKVSQVIAEMEYTGVLIDRPKLLYFLEKTENEIEFYSEELFKLAGYSFAITGSGSTTQVQKAYERATGHKILFYTKPTDEQGKQKADKYTTDIEQAGKQKKPCWNSSAIAQYLEYAKANNQPKLFDFVYNYYQLDHRTRLKNNYLEAILRKLDHNNRLHGRFNQHGTKHGRLSSDDPNLQNITKSSGNADLAKIEKIIGAKDEEALNRKLRELFLPDPGYEWLCMDWRQIEYVVATYFAADEAMIKLFYDDPNLDYHEITAKLAGLPGKEGRDEAKTVNFGILYGMGIASLAFNLGVSINQAKIIRNKVFSSRPALRRLINDTTRYCEKTGYIINPLGRKVHVDFDKGYKGLNFWVAGTVGDLMKERMLAVDQVIKSQKLPVKMLLTVHDELDFQSRIGYTSQVAPILGDTFCDIRHIKMPVQCVIKTGINWGTLAKYPAGQAG